MGHSTCETRAPLGISNTLAWLDWFVRITAKLCLSIRVCIGEPKINGQSYRGFGAFRLQPDPPFESLHFPHTEKGKLGADRITMLL